MNKVTTGDEIRGKKVKDVVNLSSGWQVVKTENGKSPRDFRVKIISPQHPRGLTIKHAHFAIDFYGKKCQDKAKALKLLEALGEMWHGTEVEKLIEEYKSEVKGLPGYNLEYILYSLKWILEQEDINFTDRPSKKQKALDNKIEKQDLQVPEGRKGSQLAMGLFCDIANGVHPVEAFYSAGLRI